MIRIPRMLLIMRKIQKNPYDSSDYPEDPDSETYDNPSDEAGTTEVTNEDVYGKDELPSGGSEVSNGEQDENSYDNPGEASNEDTDDNAYEDPAETSDETRMEITANRIQKQLMIRQYRHLVRQRLIRRQQRPHKRMRQVQSRQIAIPQKLQMTMLYWLHM